MNTQLFLNIVHQEEDSARKIAQKFVPDYNFKTAMQENFLAYMNHDRKEIALSLLSVSIIVAEIMTEYQNTLKFPKIIEELIDDIKVNRHDERQVVRMLSFYIILGVYLHEIAHVMYTPVHTKYSDAMKRRQTKAPEKFVHYIANLVEDAYIQRRFLHDFTFKKAKYAMRACEEIIQGPKAVENLNSQTKTDIKQLLFYLVLTRYNRGIKTPLPNDIVSEFLSIYYIENTDLRVDKTLDFSEKLFGFLKSFEQDKHLEDQKPNKKQDDSDRATMGETALTPPNKGDEQEQDDIEEDKSGPELSDNDNMLDNEEEDAKSESNDSDQSDDADEEEDTGSEGTDDTTDTSIDEECSETDDTEERDEDTEDVREEEGSDAEGGDSEAEEDDEASNDGPEESDADTKSKDDEGGDSEDTIPAKDLGDGDSDDSDDQGKSDYTEQGEKGNGSGGGDEDKDSDLEPLTDEELEDVINDIIEELLEDEDIQHEGDDKGDSITDSSALKAQAFAEVRDLMYRPSTQRSLSLSKVGEELSKSFQASFKRIQSYTFNSRDYNRKQGRFDQKIAHKTVMSNRVFYKKYEPKRDMDLYALLSLDCSYSMNDDMTFDTRLIDYFREVSISLLHALESVKAKTEMLAFASQTHKVKGVDQRVNKEKLHGHLVGAHNNHLNGSTAFIGSMQYAENIFKVKQNKDKLFIIFTDGHFDESREEIKSYADSLHKQKVNVVLIGINLNNMVLQSFEETFSNALVKNYRGGAELQTKLPKELSTYLTNKFMKNKEA